MAMGFKPLACQARWELGVLGRQKLGGQVEPPGLLGTHVGPTGSRGEPGKVGWEAPVEASADSVRFNFKPKCKQAPVPDALAQIKLVL